MRRHLQHHSSPTWFHGIMVISALAVVASGYVIYRHMIAQPSVSDQYAHDQYVMKLKRNQMSGPPNSRISLTQPISPSYALPHEVNGIAPVLTRIETKQPVVFLTIDDGAYKDPKVIGVMAKYHLKASLFLAKSFIVSDPQFFAQLTALGSRIENHTLSHDLKMTKRMNYQQQKAEICGMADYEQATYGTRPLYFRPPGGIYTDIMRRAAHDCSMKAIVTWMVTVNDGALQYQVGNSLRPGDIVLMHFRPSFVEDIEAFVSAMKTAGLHTELLESAIVTK